MATFCSCPPGAQVVSIENFACPIDWGQIRRIIFQRKLNDSGVRNSFVIASADPTLVASWNTFFTAADSTKMVITPTIGNPEFAPGEPRTFGDGNEVPGGVPIVVGADGTEFTSVLYSIPQYIEYQMKQLQCEDLQAYFINEAGKIFGVSTPQKTDSTTSVTGFTGFPIEVNTLFVGDRAPGGHESPDTNALNFSLAPDCSISWHDITPADFNALVDLANS